MKKTYQETYKGSVEHIIFKSKENFYTIFSLTNSADGEEVVCTGYVDDLAPGEEIKVTGNLVNHPTYGPQLNITHYEKMSPSTASAIEKYLAARTIKGIGSRMAKTIVNTFGDATLEIMENHPEKLAEIKGITLKKAGEISQTLKNQGDQRQTIISLGTYGISPAYALKIYKKYKEKSLYVLKENPYLLSSDITGIGFKIADKVAQNFGINPDSPFRIKSALRYSLNHFVNLGHVCVEKENLINYTISLLGLNDKSLIDNAITELQLEKVIVQERFNDEIYIYHNYFFLWENYIAKKLQELSLTKIKAFDSIDEKIKIAASALNLELATEQISAVKKAMEKGVLVITGGPGTGKTTIIKTIVTLFTEEGYQVELAAPTGRAAKRMTETTGYEAKTIHRMLGINFLEGNIYRQIFDKDEENPLEADIIIIDETSMVDLMLMNHLLKAVDYGSRLIFVGDADQLPSVGAGNVLRDIIAGGCIPTVRLTEIFRQAKESMVITNAHRINQGKYPIINSKNTDFFFIRQNSQEGVVSAILDLCQRRLPGYQNISQKDIQVLCPMKKSLIGVHNLNIALQDALNPPTSAKNEVYFHYTFREGDKVIQTQNNYETEWTMDDKIGQGIFNGDEGIIESIDLNKELIMVKFYDGKVVEYGFNQNTQLDLSYALTIHKSQGSEYKAVIIPVHSGPPMLLNRNLLYTALTRAKKLAVFVGLEETLYKMVDNNREVQRNSFLKERLKKMHELLSETGN